MVIKSIILQELLASLGVQMVMVSFGSQKGAARWKRETGCTHTVVTDQSRKFYNYFGLRISFSKVWGSQTMHYYAGQIQQGKQFLKPFENEEDDPLQMGGDFLVDKCGKLLMCYPQKYAADRPSIQSIINCVQNATQ
ncbi:uncharacterized protein LOC134841739 [Symsagittifera roscoffensis]|uniref:uncharacterized protein LOC134841739 n=1 Tax=Symsagittifera roscoffensis TaxID=84072 RepID=UPI00307C57E3